MEEIARHKGENEQKAEQGYMQQAHLSFLTIGVLSLGRPGNTKNDEFLERAGGVIPLQSNS